MRLENSKLAMMKIYEKLALQSTQVGKITKSVTHFAKFIQFIKISKFIMMTFLTNQIDYYRIFFDFLDEKIR